MALPPVLEKPFLVHDWAPGGEWAVDRATLEWLHAHLRPGARTLETGAGMSTVCFAVAGARHTCVVPDPLEVERIRTHCAREGVSTGNVDFVVEESERALPRLALADLDLVLVDGRHGFPTPMLDWFYAARMLRVGGFAVLDDTQLWSVRVLRDFLAAEPAWRLERELSRSVVFEKTAAASQGTEWFAQPYVVAETERLARATRGAARRREALDLLRRGDWVSLAAKVGRLVGRRAPARPR
jgi:hypothetical protein